MEQSTRTAEGIRTCGKDIEQWTIEGVPQMIRSAEATMDEGPKVIVLACRWRYFAGSDIEGLKRLASEVDYRVVRTPCSGQVNADWIATALGSGADAVMVLGGHAGCAFTGDRSAAEVRLKEQVAEGGCDTERMVVDWNGPRPQGIEGSVDRVVAAVKRVEDPR
jgi:coenzyme F420-reducing hydrogenase delta subunit